MQDDQLILSSAADAEFQIVNSLGHRLVTHLSERDEVISMDIAGWHRLAALGLPVCQRHERFGLEGFSQPKPLVAKPPR